MKEIKIVEGHSEYNIENTVNALLKTGWELYGEMKVREGSDKDNDIYYVYWIVMVK